MKLSKGAHILPAIDKIDDYEIMGFYANSQKFVGTYENGLYVYSLFEAMNMYKTGEISRFVLNSAQGMDPIERDYRIMKQYNVHEEDFLIALPEFIEHETAEWLVPVKEYHYLPYLEYHVADHCNLNCKGCVHFSPLVKDKSFPDFSSVENDLRQMKKIVPYIGTIRILGGEPFLNPELPKYMRLTREIYPYADISVVTNALLINSCTFLEDFIKYNINIDISLYKPLMNMAGDIIKKIKEKGINATISEPIENFAYALDSKGGHARFAQQHNCTCPNLYDGGLYVCPIIAYMRYFNEFFGYDFDDKDGRINIYDNSLSFEQLKLELHKVRKTCDNCLYISDEHLVFQQWSQTTKASISDYMI